MEVSPEKTNSKLEWFFFIFVLPLLFITLLAFILLWFLDYDIKGNLFASLNEVPVIEKLIPDDFIQEELNSKPLDPQTLITNLQKTVNQKDQAVLQLETELRTKGNELNELEKKYELLEQKQEEELLDEQQRIEELKQLAKIYENMSTKNAAKILSELSYKEAVLIFSQMAVEPKSKILEKMDPKISADLSILLKDQTYSKDLDIAALQQRVDKLVEEMDRLRENEVKYNDLAATFSAMNPVNAASTLLTIADTDPQLVYQILATMDTGARSNLLSQIDEINSTKAAQFTMGIAEVQKK